MTEKENFEQKPYDIEALKVQMEEDQTNLHNMLNEWYDKAVAANHDPETEKALEQEYLRKLGSLESKAEISYTAFLKALGYYDRNKF